MGEYIQRMEDEGRGKRCPRCMEWQATEELCLACREEIRSGQSTLLVVGLPGRSTFTLVHDDQPEGV